MMWNLFSFETSDGLELYGGLVKAKKPTKSVVVHIHGMTDQFFEGRLVEAVAAASLTSGHDFFAFNNRGAGVV